MVLVGSFLTLPPEDRLKRIAALVRGSLDDEQSPVVGSFWSNPILTTLSLTFYSGMVWSWWGWTDVYRRLEGQPFESEGSEKLAGFMASAHWR
ncbi:MAG: hypothetical protein D6759_06595 [Chloroflexi bacterium]|nr:MAG: hypothetical protein D6759_06595 [Chloroflexota bacterium]